MKQAMRANHTNNIITRRRSRLKVKPHEKKESVRDNEQPWFIRQGFLFSYSFTLPVKDVYLHWQGVSLVLPV
jgi:hypothetical protein